MKKNNLNINPIGLKGQEQINEMRRLMGIKSLNENTIINDKSKLELIKKGPDGKIYGIVKENHEFYIKVSDKTNNVNVNDFKYIGGLQNKKSEMYETYAKAIKHLNLKFINLSESLGKVNTINVFENDNLLAENQTFAGGMGFVKEEEISEEEKSKNNPWAICTASVGRDDKEKYERCVMDVKKEKGIKEELTESEYMGLGDDIELTETEKAIDNMKNKEYGLEEVEIKENKKHKLSIINALDKMDDVIESSTINEDKINNILNTLNEAELNKLLTLKKKI